MTRQEMENAFAFITEQQAKFEENFARAEKRFVRAEKRLDRLEELTERLTRAVDERETARSSNCCATGYHDRLSPLTEVRA